MSKKKIRCFVALALGHKDVDAIYDNHIFPVLTSKKLGIEPFRIDKKEHNDDLNVTIAKEIEKADIAIADLTYARPSVYWEAGFAQRSIPVIYTVRTDHLKEEQSDESLRVHFDLKMKNIIDWKSPSDPNFSKRLDARLKYLLNPIKQMRAQDEKQEEDRKKFSSLSVSDRCVKIQSHFSSIFENANYQTFTLREINRYIDDFIVPAFCLIAAKMIKSKVIYHAVLIGDILTKKQIHTITKPNLAEGLIPKDIPKDRIRLIEEHYYFCSMKKFPLTRLTSLYPRLTPSENPNLFTLLTKSKYSIDRSEKMWICSPIRSESEVIEWITENLKIK